MKAFATTAACALLALTAATAVFAQTPPPAEEKGLPMLALTNIPAKGMAKLVVTSPAFKEMGDIPFVNTQYQGNKFPGLMWTGAPATTKSFAIIMQDTDGIRNNMPILHWTMFNIPGTAKGLPADMAPTANPAGSSYGANIRGPNQAYMGPRTPAGPKHRYHMQVFALDTVLPAEAGATYDSLTAAMKDHVVASGQLIGLGQVDPAAPPPAAPATPPAAAAPAAK